MTEVSWVPASVYIGVREISRSQIRVATIARVWGFNCIWSHGRVLSGKWLYLIYIFKSPFRLLKRGGL